jgi:hypothetical protein
MKSLLFFRSRVYSLKTGHSLYAFVRKTEQSVLPNNWIEKSMEPQLSDSTLVCKTNYKPIALPKKKIIYE